MNSGELAALGLSGVIFPPHRRAGRPKCALSSRTSAGRPPPGVRLNRLAGKTVTPEQQALLDEMRSRVVVIFNESMSWQVMEPLTIDVYRTDAGRAVIRKMPVVMQHTMAAMQENLRAMMPKIQEVQKDILARMRALDQQPTPQP